MFFRGPSRHQMKKFHTPLTTSIETVYTPFYFLTCLQQLLFYSDFFPDMATTILTLGIWVQQLNKNTQRLSITLSLNSNLIFICVGGGCSFTFTIYSQFLFK